MFQDSSIFLPFSTTSWTKTKLIFQLSLMKNPLWCQITSRFIDTCASSKKHFHSSRQTAYIYAYLTLTAQTKVCWGNFKCFQTFPYPPYIKSCRLLFLVCSFQAIPFGLPSSCSPNSIRRVLIYMCNIFVFDFFLIRLSFPLWWCCLYFNARYVV